MKESRESAAVTNAAILQHLQEPAPSKAKPDRFEAFAVHVSSELRRMDEDLATFVMSQISQLLFSPQITVIAEGGNIAN